MTDGSQTKPKAGLESREASGRGFLTGGLDGVRQTPDATDENSFDVSLHITVVVVHGVGSIGVARANLAPIPHLIIDWL